MSDIVEMLRDLHRQATEERSHYYVGKCVRDSIAEIERLRVQHKRQASMNAHLAALVTDAQEELRKCQQDAIQLQARLVAAEALLREALESVEADARFAEHYSPYGADVLNGRVADIRAFLAADSASAAQHSEISGYAESRRDEK